MDPVTKTVVSTMFLRTFEFFHNSREERTTRSSFASHLAAPFRFWRRFPLASRENSSLLQFSNYLSLTSCSLRPVVHSYVRAQDAKTTMFSQSVRVARTTQLRTSATRHGDGKKRGSIISLRWWRESVAVAQRGAQTNGEACREQAFGLRSRRLIARCANVIEKFMIQSHVTKTANDASAPLHVCMHVRVCIGSESENERSRANERRGSASVNVNANSNTAVIIMPAPWRLNVSSITECRLLSPFWSQAAQLGTDVGDSRDIFKQLTKDKSQWNSMRNISRNITEIIDKQNTNRNDAQQHDVFRVRWHWPSVWISFTFEKRNFLSQRYTIRCISCPFNPSNFLSWEKKYSFPTIFHVHFKRFVSLRKYSKLQAKYT